MRGLVSYLRCSIPRAPGRVEVTLPCIAAAADDNDDEDDDDGFPKRKLYQCSWVIWVIMFNIL